MYILDKLRPKIIGQHNNSANSMKKLKLVSLILPLILVACKEQHIVQSEEKLIRQSYTSSVDKLERDYFIYLPPGYDAGAEANNNKTWPLMLFLHGNGERGNAKDELDYVLKNGPLYEAWIQKKDIPFIIISPQLHMFDFDKQGLPYIDNRKKSDVPQRLQEGVPKRPVDFPTPQEMSGAPAVNDMSAIPPLLPMGWEQVEDDLLQMLAEVKKNYRVDEKRVVISGLSYGGFGTWYMASKHPELFSAMVPVVGWGHPDLVEPIAKHKIPLWVFAGGRDDVVPVKHFYAGLNKLEALGHKSLRFTVHEDMGHDAWTRVYASDDLYKWMLEHEIQGP